MYGKDNNLGRKGGDERRDLYFYVTSLYINIYFKNIWCLRDLLIKIFAKLLWVKYIFVLSAKIGYTNKDNLGFPHKPFLKISTKGKELL